MSITAGYRSVSVLTLALALLCLGLVTASTAGAAELPYTPNPELSLTGDCSVTPGIDEIPDPDCEGEPPAYPPLPDRPTARFDRPSGIAVDDWGNLYVASRSNDGSTGRIDIFDSEGHFISELPDPHGPLSLAVDSEGNIYAYEQLGASRELVRYPPETYNPEAGEIEYSTATRDVVTTDVSFLINGVGIDRRNPLDASDDRLFVAESDRIREYGSAEEGNKLLETIEPEGLIFATWIAVDSERRRLYTQSCKEVNKECVIWVFEADAPYNLLKEVDGSTTPAKKFFSNQGWIGVGVDETNGHLFVGDLTARDDIYEFDESYEFVSTFALPGGPAGNPVQLAVADSPEAPDPEDLNPDDNYRHLFVPRPDASGNVLAFTPPGVDKPLIRGSAAVGIGETEAELETEINPKQAETTYSIECVSEAQFQIDEFESAMVAASGMLPATNSFERVSAVISGLEPGTAYRLRVTASNEIGSADPEEASFATYEDADPRPDPCSNDTLRIGLSAALPDCRAYELVTPADTNGRAPLGAGFESERFGSVQSSPGGGAVSFELLSGTLPGTEGTGYAHGDPYLATRTPTGWSSALAGPTGTEASQPKPGSFSPDQGYSFWTAEGSGPAVVGGNATGYVRYPDGRSELIGRGSLGTDPRALGRLITEGGTHIVFQSGNSPVKLESEAPSSGVAAVYDRTPDEVTHVVSLLPGEVTPSAGAAYLGASADGEGIAFEIGTTLYLRVGNEITYEIATGVTFAGVSEGGERVFYLQGGDLKAFDTTSEEVITFADTAAAVIPVNVAPQGNRAYFVSEEAVAGSAANPEGDEAQAGEQNLYLSEEGTITFVATVTERDVEGVDTGSGIQLDGLGTWTLALQRRQPAVDASRLTPDGGVLLFQSRAELTGYQSDEEAQIYRYDHAAGRLHCISCSPTGIPTGEGASLQSIALLDIASPFSPFGFVPALRADGDRAFFESTEALVSYDIDGRRDVYEWEEAGVGSCPSTREGGCVYLLSSGRSARDDYLFGHSDSGDDVFISTADILVKGDGSTISIYDARIGGGFASQEKVPCAEEGCRPSLTPPPALPTPQAPNGSPDNVVKPKKCPKGKRKVKRQGKVVCVKKKKQGRNQRGKTSKTRGASR